MDGFVAQRRGWFYVVIYEGRDPVTGKELRRWHPARTDRAEAERLAARLAKTGSPDVRAPAAVAGDVGGIRRREGLTEEASGMATVFEHHRADRER
jgi:hypothetical protein